MPAGVEVPVYSQYDEQSHILANTPAVGRFLDIGAYHPTKFSNTRALYERGWSGVMIEPSPIPMEALLREYGEDSRITLMAAIVETRAGCLATLHVTQDALSTTDEKWFKRMDGQAGYRGGFYGSLVVPTVSVTQLTDCYGPFDFVNIDTEGTSEELLREVILRMRPLPACICCEMDEVISIVPRGYRDVYHNKTNTVYVKL